MNFGTIQVADIFVGALNATEAYFGTEKVWESTPSTEGWTKVKYTAASGYADWEGDIVGTLGSSSIPDKKSAEEVEIGTHVTEIGSLAFSNCRNLTSVTIPDGVIRIAS